MSLLIKALDKAQAEKQQVKKGAAAKKTAAKTKSSKAAKRKNTKASESLSLEEASIASKTEAIVPPHSEDMPQALKGTAADVAQQPQADTAEALSLTPAATTATKRTVEQPERAPAQTQAANVFTAKQPESNNRAATIAVIIGLLALSLLGAFAYWYHTAFNTPDIVIPPKPIAQQTMPAPLPAEMVAANDVSSSTGADLVSEVPSPEMIDVAQDNAPTTEQIETPPAQPTTESAQAQAVQVSEGVEQKASNVFDTKVKINKEVVTQPVAPMVEETLTENEQVIEVAQSDVVVQPNPAISITPSKMESGINTILTQAYEAYNAGKNKQAAEGYKAVLKRYGPNVDAMLGLAAIATRQGRLADAQGWYQRVIEVEPRNEVARTGLLSLQSSEAKRPLANESNLKSMIATTPEDANLHATLGDVYANQNQWAEAQQAYFDAYRLNQSAENAFNLAVSLDQIGKPQLALPYYREALQKADQSNVIDVSALQARISSIE